MSKFFCAVVLSAVFCLAAGFPVDDDVTGQGVAKQYRVQVEAFANFALKSNVENYEAHHVKFYLHTKQQPEVKYEIKHVDFLHYLKNSTFQGGRPTKIFIHDRLFPASYYKELVNAYLRHYPKSVNVITVDYSYFSGVEHKKFIQLYQEIGATVGKFIQVLCDYGVVGEKIHVIGHGVGAHIASVAVRKVPSVKVDRITGLDPTGLEFDEDKNLPQLQKHDAIFVDVIVTNANGVGSKDKSRGHVNFFPNGGDSQPRSNMVISHLKSYFYFVESIARGKVFEACVVETYETFKTASCRHAKVINYMGEYVLKNQVGDFYLDTHPVPPYSMSEDTHFHFDEAKLLGESYFSQVLGTKLAPFTFVSKEDGYYKNAVANSNTLFKGFGEEDQLNVHVHKHHGDKAHHEVALRYSNDLEH